MSVCPSGCVCQLLRAQGSNVTYAPLVRAGCGALKSGSIRTVPVKYSAGPRAEGSDPLRLSSISIPNDDDSAVSASAGAMSFDVHVVRGEPVHIKRACFAFIQPRLSNTSFAVGNAENTFGQPA